MKIYNIHFKSDDKYVPPGWHVGYDDGIKYYDGQLIHKRILKFSDTPGYTNGWAEANITAYSELHNYLRSTLEGRSQ